MGTAQTGRTHDLHPTASRKPKEFLDPWAPSTHDPSATFHIDLAVSAACLQANTLTSPWGRTNEWSVICCDQARKSETRYDRRICEARESGRFAGHAEDGRFQGLLPSGGCRRHDHCRVAVHQ